MSNSLPKKLRFEVFKRDKFTCQYCGAQAPDVVLEVDHVTPRAEGGTDELLNLVASCSDCNRGKGPVELSDDSAVKVTRARLEELEERRQQIEMMLEWKRELRDLDTDVLQMVADRWAELLDHTYHLNEVGIQNLRKILRQFSVQEVLEGIEAAADTYIKYDESGKPTKESVELATAKLGGVCMTRRKEQETPDLRQVYYIRGIVRNRMYYDKRRVTALLLRCLDAGLDLDSVRQLAVDARHWTEFRSTLEEWLEEVEDP